MSNSERKLLGVFLALIAVLGGALVVQQFRAWQHRIDRKERDVELTHMEAVALLSEADSWRACAEWLGQTQPAAQSDFEARQGLLDTLNQSARDAGLSITHTKDEPKQTMPFYRQYGVTLTVEGDVKPLFQWLYNILQPSAFYVVPSLSITPDKEDPTKIAATVQVWRWYQPDLAAAPESTEEAQPSGQ